MGEPDNTDTLACPLGVCINGVPLYFIARIVAKKGNETGMVALTIISRWLYFKSNFTSLNQRTYVIFPGDFLHIIIIFNVKDKRKQKLFST